VATTERSYCLT